MLRSIFIAFLFISPAIWAQHPLYFDQISSQAFVARGPGGSFGFTNRDIWLSDSVRVVLHGANRNGVVHGLDPLPGKSNYFLGPRSNWRTGIAQFARIEYKSVYPGIDLIFHPSGQEMEYDFVLAPGADAMQIRLSFEGSRGLEVDENGNLLISTREGKLLQRVPRVFQGSETVDAEYALLDSGLVAFKLASYDKSKPLIIDPVVVFQNFIGGSRQDVPAGIGVDAKGNIYVAGTTNSIDFPRISQLQNPIHGSTLLASADYGQNYFRPNIDTPILQITAAHGQPDLLYAATTNGPYRSRDGGRNWMAANAGLEGITISSIAADTQDPARVYAATPSGVTHSGDGGQTWSIPERQGDFSLPGSLRPILPINLIAAGPQTVYAFLDGQPSKSTDGGQTWTPLVIPQAADAVAVFADPSNPTLLFVELDSYKVAPSPRVIVSKDGGNTWSTPVPLNLVSSPEAIAVSPTNPSQVFAITSDGVARSVDSGASWSIAGLQGLTLNALAIDPAHPANLYVVATEGIYVSSDSGATFRPIAQQQPKRGLHTIFFTRSTTPLMLVGGDPGNDIFVVKWNPAGDRILYTTYLGGSFEDSASAMKVDADGNVYVAGTTQSTDFPVTPGAAQSRLKGERNGFVSKLSPDGTRLLASTLIGGSAITDLNALAIDATGNAYVTGYTTSPDFPITPGVVQSKLADACFLDALSAQFLGDVSAGDAFVAKINADGSRFVYSTYLGGSCSDAGQAIFVSADGSVLVGGSSYSPDFTNRSPAGFNPFAIGFLVKLDSGGVRFSAVALSGQPLANNFASVSGVVVDDAGNIYATGNGNACFIGVLAPFPSTISFSPAGCGFSVVKIDPAKTVPLYSKSFIANGASVTSISLDSSGNAWIAGGPPYLVPFPSFNITVLNPVSGNVVRPIEFPLVQPLQNFGSGILAQIGPDGETIPFATYLDSRALLALDKGAAYVAFASQSSGIHKELLFGSVPGFAASLMKIDTARTYPITINPPSGSDPIGPGEIVDIPGNGIGPSTAISAALDAAGILPKNLAGVTVTLGGIPAPLISVQAKTIRCVVPFGIAGHDSTTLEVQYNGAKSNPIKLSAADAHVVVHSILNEDGTANSETNGARQGSILTMYASGFGQTDPPSVDGQVNRGPGKFALPISVDFYVSDTTAEIVYAGPAPGQVAGIGQINVPVPSRPGNLIGIIRAGNSYATFNAWVNRPAMVK